MESKIIQYNVPKKTTHLMMWLGSSIPEKKVINYKKGCEYEYEERDRENVYINYVKLLEGECKKMAKKKECCILVYDSKMINAESEREIKRIVKNIPNCYLVDYEKFVEKVKSNNDNENRFMEQISEQIIRNKTKKVVEKFGRYHIGNLVDCMRMLLLLYPSKLKQFALDQDIDGKKSIKPDPQDFSLLYHDFDMIQKNENFEERERDNNELKSYDLVFCKPMDNSNKYVKLENGIIFVNSNNDKNEKIAEIVKIYLNSICIDENYSLFFAILDRFRASCERVINDFSNQYKDEGHRTWEKKIIVAQEEMIEKQNNNNNKNYLFYAEDNLYLDNCVSKNGKINKDKVLDILEEWGYGFFERRKIYNSMVENYLKENNNNGKAVCGCCC